MKIPPPTEHEEQCTLVQWAGYSVSKYPELELLYAIPNGGLRNIRVAIKLAREGVKRGVPDLHLPVARGGYHSLYIEMKRIGGKLSPNQIEIIEKLREQGHMVCVCYGAEQAIEQLERYLNL